MESNLLISLCDNTLHWWQQFTVYHSASFSCWGGGEGTCPPPPFCRLSPSLGFQEILIITVTPHDAVQTKNYSIYTPSLHSTTSSLKYWYCSYMSATSSRWRFSWGFSIYFHQVREAFTIQIMGSSSASLRKLLSTDPVAMGIERQIVANLLMLGK